MIKQRTIYTYDKQDFETLAKLKTHIENEIGNKVIDMMDNGINQKLTAKQKLEILKILSHPTGRKQLTKLLNITYEVEVEDGSMMGHSTEKRNILDL